MWREDKWGKFGQAWLPLVWHAHVCYFPQKRTHASWTPGLSSAFCLRLFFEVSDSRINWNFLNVITDNLVRLDIISLPKWVYFLLDLQYQATVGSNTICEQPLNNTHPQIYRQSLFSSDRSSSVYPGLIMPSACTHFFQIFHGGHEGDGT